MPRKKITSQQAEQPMLASSAKRSSVAVLKPVLSHSDLSAEKTILTVVWKMLAFGALRPDWDSYGAAPIELQAVQKAETLFSQMINQLSVAKREQLHPFDVAPLANGGVQLEWRSPKGALEVEIHSQPGHGYLLTLGQGATRQFQEGDDATDAEIIALLSQVI